MISPKQITLEVGLNPKPTRAINKQLQLLQLLVQNTNYRTQTVDYKLPTQTIWLNKIKTYHMFS